MTVLKMARQLMQNEINPTRSLPGVQYTRQLQRPQQTHHSQKCCICLNWSVVCVLLVNSMAAICSFMQDETEVFGMMSYILTIQCLKV